MATQGSGILTTGTLGSVTTGTNWFQPFENKPFNIWISGTFSATVQIVRSNDNGVTWVPIAQPDLSAVLSITTPMTFASIEPNAAVLWTVQCTAYTSGTVNYRFDT